MALTFEDINFKTNEIDINKTISRDITGTTIAPPKTKNSIRTIYCPEDLVKEIENYKNSFYEFNEKERLFPFSYDALRRRLVSVSKKCDLKQKEFTTLDIRMLLIFYIKKSILQPFQKG